MKHTIPLMLLFLLLTVAGFSQNNQPECTGGWKKYEFNPILGGHWGAFFDVSIMQNDAGKYRMYCSWRDKESIAVCESEDGINWSLPVDCMRFPDLKWGVPLNCLKPSDKNYWEGYVNRPIVLQKDGLYHIWFTGQIWYPAQSDGHSWIGYATSKDGLNWTMMSNRPVLSPETPWEKVAVMNAHVLWDEQEKLFKMWYSGGDQCEPNEIGYATSKDGLNWDKYSGNPVFSASKQNEWEQDRVAGCQVIKRSSDYLMFYIGYSKHMDNAQIGMARSKDGITWERFHDNPIIRRGTGWDQRSVFKPYVIADVKNNRWLLYYNGRNGGNGNHEQIGIAVHEGMDLGF